MNTGTEVPAMDEVIAKLSKLPIDTDTAIALADYNRLNNDLVIVLADIKVLKAQTLHIDRLLGELRSKLRDTLAGYETEVAIPEVPIKLLGQLLNGGDPHEFYSREGKVYTRIPSIPINHTTLHLGKLPSNLLMGICRTGNLLLSIDKTGTKYYRTGLLSYLIGMPGHYTILAQEVQVVP